MKILLELFGRVAYVIGYPVFVVYLRKTIRTRVIIRHKDQLLLVQSLFGNGGWDFPGGGVHRGEAVLQAASREIHEELGIALRTQSLKQLKTYEVSQGPIRFEVAPFSITLNPKPIIKLQRTELLSFRWVSLHELGPLKLSQGVEGMASDCLNS